MTKDKEIDNTLAELGDRIYNHLLEEMGYTEEQLKLAIAENRLHIDEVEFVEQEDGTSLMTFDARIEDNSIKDKKED